MPKSEELVFDPYIHKLNGTMRLLKGRKTFRNGASIVGSLESNRFYSTEGRQVKTRSKPPVITTSVSDVGDRIRLLWKRNLENKQLVNHNLIHLIGHIDTLIMAYELIKSNPGNMTQGPTKETLDGTSLEMLTRLSACILSGQYKFGPSRRIWIAKTGKTSKRPLGIGEKIVQKAIHLVLEAIYEPSFLDCSHGFRPARGTHTALRMLNQKFKGANWVIEGHISKCFDSFSHPILLKILKKRISCDKTLALLKSGLEAGYMDFGKFTSSGLVGTPQGSIISPLLCNIYMHELDTFVMNLHSEYTRGLRRRDNPTYKHFSRKWHQAYRSGDTKLTRHLRRKVRSLHSVDFMDNKFIRVQYIRYADDFVISISGPRSLAVLIQQKVKNFLSSHLQLDLSEDKTKLTHFTHKPIMFLGTSILNRMLVKEKPVRLVRGARKRVTPHLTLHAPIKIILEKLVTKKFLKWNNDGSYCEGTALRRLINLDHSDILNYYQSVIKGILNYYSFVDNKANLWWPIHALKFSCVLTLALKYKLKTKSGVLSRFGRNLKDPESKKELILPKTLGRTGEFKINPISAFDAINQKWYGKLTRSNLGKLCVICGLGPVEMHHVRKIKDLKNRPHLD
uniref:Reverse transcriptase domain-containing protein n=1 Tax=Coleochaete scutata TaxID=3125 RepID=A0A5P9NW26_COLSC|nr:hypothetical protein [Coleochaete scutata]QFU80176.1 hypothetical protein [Coleochaete scutata]